MHYLAYFYHWERNTVRTLPITEPRKWVELLIEHKKAERASVEEGVSEGDF